MELIVEVGNPGLRGRVPGNPKLIVSACEGRLAVGALIAPERAVYHLVGDQAAVGEVAFTFGGQPGGTWPRRYLVDLDHAISVTQDFLATGTVEQSTGPWDRASWYGMEEPLYGVRSCPYLAEVSPTAKCIHWLSMARMKATLVNFTTVS